MWKDLAGLTRKALPDPDPRDAIAAPGDGTENRAGAVRRLALEREMAFLKDYVRRLEAGEVEEGERILWAARLEAGWTPPALPEGTRLVRKAAQERFVSTGLTGEQSFALEANCLIRLNGAEAGRERRHFPLLAEADREGMTLATTWAGRSLDSLEPDRSVAVRDLPGQVEAIVAGLDRAGVIHLDLHASGKNLIVSEDGTLSLIDYGTAVLDRVPWSAVMREKLERFDEEGGYAGSAQRLRRMVTLCPGIRLLVLVLDCVGVALLHGAWPGLWELRQAGLPLEEAGPISA